jgi:hypothetical protein
MTADPASQLNNLDKRERQLRRALALMSPVEKLHAAAESVRSAQLLVLKGYHEIVRYNVPTDSRRLKSIERKRAYWRTISAEAILIKYVRSNNRWRGP